MNTELEPGHFGSNTVEDILGEIWFLQSAPDDLSPSEIRDLLSQLIARVEEKLSRNRNKIRAAWFGNAIDLLRQATKEFAAHRYSGQFDTLVRKADEQIASGNRAHRRKATFIASPGGEIDSA